MSVLKSLNLSDYLLQLGMPTKLVDLLTAPVDRVYDVVTSSGIQIFIFLSALNAVPSSLYEAAYVEGATGWESFWKITFPMVMPMILVNVVYSIVDTFTSVNNEVMEYIDMLSYQRFDFGLASAMDGYTVRFWQCYWESFSVFSHGAHSIIPDWQKRSDCHDQTQQFRTKKSAIQQAVSSRFPCGLVSDTHHFFVGGLHLLFFTRFYLWFLKRSWSRGICMTAVYFGFRSIGR